MSIVEIEIDEVLVNTEGLDVRYTLDLTGIIIPEDELDDTKIFRRNGRTGEECEIPFDSDDIKEEV
tara:strand:- start:336 stop:533 length:198 start_codon:yes stop_codon:yes gene_type:complete